jgi:hypothetical protein
MVPQSVSGDASRGDLERAQRDRNALHGADTDADFLGDFDHALASL